MDSSMYPVLIYAPFFIYLMHVMIRGAICPDCGERLHGLISPFKKTKRQWIEGGYVCPVCGCEVNMSGGKVPPNTPVRMNRFVATMFVVSSLLLICLTLIAFFQVPPHLDPDTGKMLPLEPRVLGP